jgi:hypothetical protein
MDISIGDCKAYKYSTKSGRVEEITKGNRGNQDAKDPGGRLGPTLEGGAPDLRNLKLYCVFCEEGDLIIAASDGVHDNFGSLQDLEFFLIHFRCKNAWQNSQRIGD